MGHLREKYTKEYFTGKDECGNAVGYGATSLCDKNGNFTSREHDRKILDQIIFKDKNVLSLGTGRGEELCHAIEKGAAYCLGVDFSESALKIAKELAERRKLAMPELVNDDALLFLDKYVKGKKAKKFDIVIMFDFVEHVPRKELKQIFKLLKQVLAKKAVLAINTPAYKHDNDVIKDGLNKDNLINCLDTSDANPATAGMHCNKYTVSSLQSFMQECGYENVTEMHFFAMNMNLPENFSGISFAERWKLLQEGGFPIKEDYTDDVIEYPYTDAPKVGWKTFEEGNLKSISMYLADSNAAYTYKNGNIDSQVIEDIISSNKENKSLVIFDVGAFVGADSLVFAKIAGSKGRVIAFEPNEYNRNRLFLNLSHNSFAHGIVTVSPYALGDKAGRLKMNMSANIDEGHSSTSRIHESHSKISDNLLPAGFFEVLVETTTLDEYVAESGIIPNVIKVDIEGSEHLFLAGATNTLREHKPLIYMEIHSEFCALLCYKFFESVKYKMSIIHEEDDNRLMVKASYDANVEKITPEEFMAEALKNTSAGDEKKHSAKPTPSVAKELSDKLQSEINKLHEEIVDIRFVNTQLQAKNTQLQNKIVDLQANIKYIQNSASWRLTKPLRKGRSFIGKFWLFKK